MPLTNIVGALTSPHGVDWEPSQRLGWPSGLPSIRFRERAGPPQYPTPPLGGGRANRGTIPQVPNPRYTVLETLSQGGQGGCFIPNSPTWAANVTPPPLTGGGGGFQRQPGQGKRKASVPRLPFTGGVGFQDYRGPGESDWSRPSRPPRLGSRGTNGKREDMP